MIKAVAMGVMMTAFASTFVAPASAQSVAGKKVGVQYYSLYKDQLAEDYGSFVFGSSQTLYRDGLNISFTNNGINIFADDETEFPYPQIEDEFSGFRFYDVDQSIADFRPTWSFSSRRQGDDGAARFSGDANNLWVNIAGLPENFSGRLSFAADAVAPVPEPATWGMMILGFGVVGASMRRRKSNVRTNVSFA